MAPRPEGFGHFQPSRRTRPRLMLQPYEPEHDLGIAGKAARVERETACMERLHGPQQLGKRLGEVEDVVFRVVPRVDHRIEERDRAAAMTTGASAGVPTAWIMKAPQPISGVSFRPRNFTASARTRGANLSSHDFAASRRRVSIASKRNGPREGNSFLNSGSGSRQFSVSAASIASFVSAAPASSIRASVASVVAMQPMPSRAHSCPARARRSRGLR